MPTMQDHPEEVKFDHELRQTYPTIIGCDEVGRGCLAGPLVTAAVIMPDNVNIPMLTDSKKIPKDKHHDLVVQILKTAVEVHFGYKNAQEIDDSNILEADHEAMRDSIKLFEHKPDLILIDGNDAQLLGTEYREQTLVKGDSKSLSISAASVLAKYMRDTFMEVMAEKYPGYGFETNAGYATKKNRDAMLDQGITILHRKSFAPIKNNPSAYKFYEGVPDKLPFNLGEDAIAEDLMNDLVSQNRFKDDDYSDFVLDSEAAKKDRGEQ